MMIHLIICVLALVYRVLLDSPQGCEEDTKVTQYKNTICQINYSKCLSDSTIEIDQCIGYKCKMQIAGKCYYYSSQSLDNKKCMSECCGYRLPTGDNYTNAIYECLQLNPQKESTAADPPSNKLVIVLACILGAVFAFTIGVCICCRKRIKQFWTSIYPESSNNNTNVPRLSISRTHNNEINFILENSTSNIKYDKEEECTICLCGFNEIRTHCGHLFHLKCIYTWISKNYRCPNCNSQDINPITVICKECRKPYVQIKIGKKNGWRHLKNSINFLKCKDCNKLN